MSVNNSSENDGNAFQKSEINIPRPVRFWLLLLLDIPSIICSLLILFHLLINKTLRWQLANHIIIILLIMGLVIELSVIPFQLSFLHLGVVQPSTRIMCLIWWFLDLGLFSGCIQIMAWGSVQRYLLIFHSGLFLIQKKRLLFHYLPLLILLLYIVIFHIIATIFPPCMNTYDYTLPVCNDFPCYLDDPVLGTLDSVVNNILPTIIISIFSLILPIRVYYQKRRLRQRHLWRKQRKMTVQLLCGCVLYLVPNLPMNLFNFAHLFGLPDSRGVEAQLYFDFLCYFVILFFPFICLGSVSELRKKLKWRGFLLLRQTQQVATVRPH